MWAGERGWKEMEVLVFGDVAVAQAHGMTGKADLISQRHQLKQSAAFSHSIRPGNLGGFMKVDR